MVEEIPWIVNGTRYVFPTPGGKIDMKKMAEYAKEKGWHEIMKLMKEYYSDKVE